MGINTANYHNILLELNSNVTLVAVSKTKPASDIQALCDLGQKDFGENYVQELIEKQAQLPADINWHFIGHLQSNKVKMIAPFVHLIHGVDSLNLLKEINKQAQKNNRIIHCLLQVFIAQEETKFGLNEIELNEIFNFVSSNPNQFLHIKIVGLMGMASFSENENLIKNEFALLQNIFTNSIKHSSVIYEPNVLSMGMSSDYKIAISQGSTMVRIGSLLFGNRG